jgi:hypothetical protein
MKRFKIFLAVMSVLLVAQTSWAVPMMINVQGRLTDTSGNPISGTIQVAFDIYSVASGGSSMWSSRPISTTATSQGIFNLIVDPGPNTFSGTFPEFTGDNYYLKIIVVNGGTDIPLSPRQRLVAVPLAITARNIRGGTVKASGEGSVAAVKGVYGVEPMVVIGSSAAPEYATGILGHTNGIGVYGQGKNGSTAVKGDNTFSTSGFVVGGGMTSSLNYYGTGVEGLGNIGVRGEGAAAGGSFESSGGHGVDGRYHDGTRLRSYGYLGSLSYGAYGKYVNSDGTSGPYGYLGGSNYGIYGWASSADMIAVQGSSSSGIGVKGTTSNSYGVYGSSTTGVGVYGKGADAGGSFESTGSGVAVYGKGATGGMFESSGGGGEARLAERRGLSTYYLDDGFDAVSSSDLTNSYGVRGKYAEAFGCLGYRVSGSTTPAPSSYAIGVYGENGGGPAIKGVSDNTTTGVGVFGIARDSVGSRGGSVGVKGVADIGLQGTGRHGVVGYATEVHDGDDGAGGWFENNATSVSETKLRDGRGAGVHAVSDRGDGVFAEGYRYGVVGRSTNGSNAGVVGVKSGFDVATRGFARSYGVYSRGDAAVDGNIYITGTGYSDGGYQAYGGNLDVAEWTKVSDKTIESGDVVVIDRSNKKEVKKSSSASSPLVAGIISTKPAFCAGGQNDGNKENPLSADQMKAKGYRMLALAGQVPCKVSAENGPIEVGDLLTSSNTPGHAMKATDPKIGTIIGKAMEPLASGKGTITVLVTLQ